MLLPMLANRLCNVYTDNMMDNDNSVNIESGKRGYHHGDLRAALVTEGLRLLKGGDVEQLSLRAVARNLGVSATAVYRHFPDKAALLAALCAEGDRMLADAQRAAQTAAGGGQAGFDATGGAYVRFALANRALFRLMMARFQELYGSNIGNIEMSQSDGLNVLLNNVAAMLFDGAPSEEKQILAVRSWAIVHGLAMLMLEGILPADESLIDKVIMGPDPARLRSTV